MENLEVYAGKTLDDTLKNEIVEKYKTHKIQFVPSNCMVTCDWRLDRIRVHYDVKTNVISRVAIG